MNEWKAPWHNPLANIEYICCSAIWFDDNKEHAHQPVKTGVVMCGLRHGNIFAQIGGSVKQRQEELAMSKEEQGFLTNKGRFVDRKEAGEIAFAAGQTDKLIDYLFSEDLF